MAGGRLLARDLRLDRAVAIKVLPRNSPRTGLTRKVPPRDAHGRSFSHPNIVPVHSVRSTTALLAFARELLKAKASASA